MTPHLPHLLMRKERMVRLFDFDLIAHEQGKSLRREAATINKNIRHNPKKGKEAQHPQAIIITEKAYSKSYHNE
jgi:hypothetical protein